MCNIFLFLFCYIMIFYTFELIELIINIIEKEKKLTKENFERKFVNTNSIAKGHIFQSILWSIPYYTNTFRYKYVHFAKVYSKSTMFLLCDLLPQMYISIVV